MTKKARAEGFLVVSVNLLFKLINPSDLQELEVAFVRDQNLFHGYMKNRRNLEFEKKIVDL